MSVLSVDHIFDDNGESKTCNVPLSTDYMFFVTGSLGGGTISLEASPDGGVTWFTVDKLSEPGRIIRYLVDGERVKMVLCNSTTPACSSGVRQ